MPKRKSKSWNRSNVPSTDFKYSTFGEVHPACSHGDGGCIRTGPYYTLSYCPEAREAPNPFHDGEFQIYLKPYTFCYHGLIKKMYHNQWRIHEFHLLYSFDDNLSLRNFLIILLFNSGIKKTNVPTKIWNLKHIWK